jgi:hypothetical protein
MSKTKKVGTTYESVIKNENHEIHDGALLTMSGLLPIIQDAMCLHIHILAKARSSLR